MFKERQIYNDLKKHLNKAEYSIIIGPRQVGKTTIIQQLYSELTQISPNVYFISLENYSILNDINADNENLFHYAKRPVNPLLKKNEEKIIVFIDEIQYLNNPSNFLKYLYDTYNKNLKIIATGSSAFYIDSKFKDSLAGRKRIFNLKSLNFNEFLLFTEADELDIELNRIRTNDEYISVHYADLLYHFDEYIKYGGYPKIVLENDTNEKLLLLDELITSFLKKDIYESQIQHEQKFFNLIILLSEQIGNMLNINVLSKKLGINRRTVEKYLFVLRKCFYIDLLSPFHKNVTKEITKMPKIYFNDLGIRNKLLNRFTNLQEREDKGSLIENYIFIRLKELFAKEQLKFWRTADQNEIDFIVNTTYEQGIAYEVKFSESNFRRNNFIKFQNFLKYKKIQPLTFSPFTILSTPKRSFLISIVTNPFDFKRRLISLPKL